MKKVLLTLILLLPVLMINTPVFGQSDVNEIVAEGRADAIVVVSDAAMTIYTILVGVLVALTGIVTITALRMVYKSIPEWLHGTVLALADKAIEGLERASQKTTTEVDDQLVAKMRGVFEEFLRPTAPPTSDKTDL